jgi:hypothetical protein
LLFYQFTKNEEGDETENFHENDFAREEIEKVEIEKKTGYLILTFRGLGFFLGKTSSNMS